MITYLLYTKNSPMQREVEHLAGVLEQFRVNTQLIEADSPQGISLTENYDMPQRPSVIVVRDDGSFVQAWQGELPPAEEISYHFHQ